MIYFIQAGGSGAIKIGYALDPRKRLFDLQVGNGAALALLGVINGGRTEEAFLHARFAHLRGVGEWFSPAAELLEFIAASVSAIPTPVGPGVGFEQEVRARFYQIIKESGWSAPDIATAAGVSNRAAQLWLMERGMPRLHSFLALARAMPTLRAQVIAWIKPIPQIEAHPQVLARIAGLIQWQRQREQGRGTP